MAQSCEPHHIAFKYFVAECNPEKSPLVGLKNNNTSRILYCYLGTLNDILAVCPKLFKIQNNVITEGVDMEIYSEEITKYNNKNSGSKKIIGVVKRFKNKVSVCVQQMFDENNSGVFKYSPCLVQFSPEDDLEMLRNFGQEMKRQHAMHVKNRMDEAAAVEESTSKEVVMSEKNDKDLGDEDDAVMMISEEPEKNQEKNEV